MSGEEESKKVSAVEIHDLLRDRICLLEYAPGTMIRENDIAVEFRVSRTPVREAFQRLSIEGLVEVRNGIGTFVKTFDLVQLHEVFDLRIEMAQLFGRIGARDATTSDMAVLENLLRRCDDLAERFDVGEHWRINHMTHFAISDLLLNKIFVEMWNNLYFRGAGAWYDMSRDISPDAVRLLKLEIVELLTAVRENDIEEIGYIKRKYIKFYWKRLFSKQQP